MPVISYFSNTAIEAASVFVYKTLYTVQMGKCLNLKTVPDFKLQEH